jgi:hypothetical protein
MALRTINSIVDVLKENQPTHTLNLEILDSDGNRQILKGVEYAVVYPVVQTDEMRICMFHNKFPQIEAMFGYFQRRIDVKLENILYIDEVGKEEIMLTIKG